ncbi:TetR/AcrR family transcriptional regulator [Nocardia colli]|uniref:TetR/AcrR family transcriptional regulator n=1 Tax=Nocardia colli TaxID=2545717 RepID=A0A5N0EHA6_9NOCA|nr:TetR/AcrR family transcriptional regulator C-terminal domain-containing protein [Nocardia colli]KAA8888373.1 TetR/AcrR family transcriptional regulator [Nocardia colli]
MPGSPRPNPRTSPAKAPLSLDAIVAASLDLVDELGCAAVSMRRVAQVLDTGSASLYVYVHDRRELMLLTHDLAVAAVELPAEADGDWRNRLELLVERTVAALAAHRDLAAVAFTEAPTGPHILRLVEEMLRLLRLGGVKDAACAWAVDLLGQYIASAALEAAARAATDEPAESVADTAARLDAVYQALPADDYPTIRELAPLLTVGGSKRETWKLRVILDGILARDADESDRHAAR